MPYFLWQIHSCNFQFYKILIINTLYVSMADSNEYFEVLYEVVQCGNLLPSKVLDVYFEHKMKISNSKCAECLDKKKFCVHCLYNIFDHDNIIDRTDKVLVELCKKYAKLCPWIGIKGKFNTKYKNCVKVTEDFNLEEYVDINTNKYIIDSVASIKHDIPYENLKNILLELQKEIKSPEVYYNGVIENIELKDCNCDCSEDEEDNYKEYRI